ncbi:flagellar M-ring protein FliF [Shewanella schlegeliana]|uniref:Flagellar M-ring protein n=1 Tax=Shewanella schlegeliana TaxID=190308 RepID=A0ABS1T378_9GAMM|nr:flagellar basal-body MS-ring/collar protein FliF [Shewanella schlegeliana]MBL4915232.1 flagellar M-ring protein FliF [Shewanella schlegeliana]MCL1111258.1 flagellar M-ring protein FliF [Shewanella schlegeliana]GIU37742.1 flagellar M-ring protein [Shewanella schlegeliana]
MSTTLTQTSPAMTDVNGNNERLNSLKQKWQQFSRGDRHAATLAILAIVAACVIVLMLWSTGQGYSPLYGNQENVDTSHIIEVLEAEGISYRLDPTSGLVLVPEDKLGNARMLLAARGVKAKVPSGMESLDASTIGTSQFMEQAKYRYSLEGELSRTIMALKAVRTARVHLAIPKKTLFIRQQPELPSASVMLDLYAGQHLQPQQITSIANLVAGSVTGMTPERVQIVDQEGNHLSSEINASQDMSQSRDKQIKYTQELEQSLISRASTMLLPILGRDNFQVQVAAMVNFNQVEETRESVDPQTVISQEKQSTNQTSGDMALGIPGALSNQPPTAEPAANNSSTNLNQQESRKFEVGRSVTHTRYQQMQLENLSISVLLNSQAAGESGWTQPQLDQMSNMVQDAIGYSAARGDQFSISSFNFAPVKVVEFEPLPWWQGESYQAYLRYFIGAILGLGMIFFVLRPLVQHLTRTVEYNIKDSDSTNNTPLMPPPEAAAALNDSAQQQVDNILAVENATTDNSWSSNLSLPAPGSPLTVQMEHLSLLANQEPARVAEVISHWISDRESEQNAHQA